MQAPTAPWGRNECFPCFPVDLSLVDMSCFPPRLIRRPTGSFQPFLQGDMDVVIWMELLGLESWWHGLLLNQANSWLPCRVPLWTAGQISLSACVLLNFIYPLKKIHARETRLNIISLLWCKWVKSCFCHFVMSSPQQHALSSATWICNFSVDKFMHINLKC